MKIKLEDIVANCWGAYDKILEIDMEREEVLLECNRWQPIDFVDFYLENIPLQSSYEQDMYSEKLKELEEQERLLAQKEKIILELLEKERVKFNEHVAMTMVSLHRTVKDLVKYELGKIKLAEKDKEIAEVTPDYLKYETAVFNREIMKLIGEKSDE